VCSLVERTVIWIASQTCGSLLHKQRHEAWDDEYSAAATTDAPADAPAHATASPSAPMDITMAEFKPAFALWNFQKPCNEQINFIFFKLQSFSLC
jgi:hypothetical protein